MRTSIRQGLLKVAQASGYTVLPNWRLDSYPQTIYLQKLFKLLDIDCVLDVGANKGQYRDFLREQVGFRGHVISFEPIPDHAAAMRTRAAADPRWSIQECALGAENGEAEFNVMASTTFSSFLQPKDSGVDQFRASNEVRQHIRVPVKTLDGILPLLLATTGAQNLYLKLDTQGFDLQVVRGAQASMQRIHALQTEASVRPIYEGVPDFSTVMQTLQQLNFEPSGIYPNNSGHFPLLVEFDFHMINKTSRMKVAANI